MSQLDSILEPIKIGAHLVPGIWRHMLPEDVLYFRVDPEKQSSCFDCPQVKAYGFHPGIRCCSYIPRVPNFLLGFALMEPSTQTVAQKFIAAGHTVPEGSQLSPAQLERSLRFLNGDSPSSSVVCPMLDIGSKKCQIYAFRSGVCSTFFCRHDQGSAGAAFWEQLGDLVSQVETALAQWSMEQAGFDLDAYFKRFDELRDSVGSCNDATTQNWSACARQHLFAEWYGREQELFLTCASFILRHKADLYAIAGRQRLRQTLGYDSAHREEFRKRFSARLIAECLPEGEPVPIPQLWYTLQLAHRNLQMHRMSSV